MTSRGMSEVYILTLQTDFSCTGLFVPNWAIFKLWARSFYTYPPRSVGQSVEKNVKNSTKADLVRYYTSARVGNCNCSRSGGVGGGRGGKGRKRRGGRGGGGVGRR